MRQQPAAAAPPEAFVQSPFVSHLANRPCIPLNAMGNPNRLPQEHRETYEGRSNDPRLDSTADPRTDARFDTNLNAGMVPPKNLSGATRILALVLGAVLFALLIWLLYWNFQTPSPRSPESPQSRAEPMVLSATHSTKV